MDIWGVIGIWLAAFLTLAIFSFLYKDNPAYKIAEHLMVGVTAGFGVINAFDQTLKPVIIEVASVESLLIRGLTVLSIILGFLLLTKLEIVNMVLPKARPLSHWPIAFITGIGVGLAVVNGVQGFLFPQVAGTITPLWSGGLPIWDYDGPSIINNWLIAGTVAVVLLYFYFSREFKGPIGKPLLRAGITMIMIGFGAAFGYTVMARVSLLIGRIYFLLHDWLHLV